MKVQKDDGHRPDPKGYPGLGATVLEAHEHLVFLLDDRAPHGLVVICKRWNQQEMARYLSDSTVFAQCAHNNWEDVEQAAAQFNRQWGFRDGSGIVYNYGIWKPTKKRFSFIAGTRSKPLQPGQERNRGPPATL